MTNSWLWKSTTHMDMFFKPTSNDATLTNNSGSMQIISSPGAAVVMFATNGREHRNGGPARILHASKIPGQYCWFNVHLPIPEKFAKLDTGHEKI